ncbi:MAG TPA: response regulator, partial [Fibrobacteria bacterium]|nr:response regulator [Fibrobacteria bacterium]
MNILIAEDDPNIREGLETFLTREGFHPHGASDGIEALELAAKVLPEFVILDVMMPRMGGYDVCREIRKRHPEVPILFLSARGEEVDRVVGLELGADDYLVKPFGTRELLARMNAILRRTRRSGPSVPAEDDSFSMDDLEIHPAELRARRG